MKNSLKNALNALGLLGFMGLAWATQIGTDEEPISMEVKFNADSSAFLLKNLEDTDFNNGSVSLFRKENTTPLDTISALVFFDDSISIKAKTIITLPLRRFVGFNRTGTVDSLSKKMPLERFIYSTFLRKKGLLTDLNATFDFKF